MTYRRLAAVSALFALALASWLPGANGTALSGAAGSHETAWYADSATDATDFGILGTTITNDASTLTFQVKVNFSAAPTSADSAAVFFWPNAPGGPDSSGPRYRIAFRPGSEALLSSYYPSTGYADFQAPVVSSGWTALTSTTGEFQAVLDRTELTSPVMTYPSFVFRVGSWANGKYLSADESDSMPDDVTSYFTYFFTSGTVETTTTTKAATTTPATVQKKHAVVDSDHDGIPNSRDGCPTTPAGPFDPNHNGCPGPYPRIAANLATQWASVGADVLVRELTLTGEPAGDPLQGLPSRTRIACHSPKGDCGWFGHPRIVGPYGVRAAIQLVTPVRFAPGAVFTIDATDPDHIGRSWTVSVVRTGNSGRIDVAHALCIPIGSLSRAIDCRAVNVGA